MRLADLLAFHWGSRAAIERIARSRGAVWIAIGLVITAALARDYDSTDLLARPWELLAPLGVSWFTATLLYLLLAGGYIPQSHRKAEPDGPPRSGWATYFTFVMLFWMTAPHAWLYGIPYEQFMSEYDATRLNLLTLAVVSVWRVLLITRVASVLLSVRFSVLLPAVLLLADSVMVVFAIAAPKPVVAIMGGVQYTETERLILDTMFFIIFWGFIAWPILALISVVTRVRSKARGRYIEARPKDGPHPSLAVWAVLVVALLGWVAAAVAMQQEVRVASRFENAVDGEEWGNAASLLAERTAEDFPPNFPPLPDSPHYGLNERLLRLAQAIEREPGAEWAAQRMQFELDGYFERTRHLFEEDLPLLIEVLPTLADGPRYARHLQGELISMQRWLDAESDADVLAQIDQLLRLGEPEPQTKQAPDSDGDAAPSE
ncbi:MAG: hypothetical protein AAGA25_16730 [Planctomycetota bacterium]